MTSSGPLGALCSRPLRRPGKSQISGTTNPKVRKENQTIKTKTRNHGDPRTNPQEEKTNGKTTYLDAVANLHMDYLPLYQVRTGTNQEMTKNSN
jgi:hypothetical protein